MMNPKIYDFEFEAMNGKDKIRLADYQGKLILLVNTASKCNFTRQYSELEKIWQQYKDKGLIIIAVPANNFGNQEPDSDEQIQQFCQLNFGISFIISKKIDVAGSNSHPFFNYTRQQLGWLSGPKWNFYKYLISKNGELITWFSSLTKPGSDKFLNIIEKNLP